MTLADAMAFWSPKGLRSTGDRWEIQSSNCKRWAWLALVASYQMGPARIATRGSSAAARLYMSSDLVNLLSHQPLLCARLTTLVSVATTCLAPCSVGLAIRVSMVASRSLVAPAHAAHAGPPYPPDQLPCRNSLPLSSMPRRPTAQLSKIPANTC